VSADTEQWIVVFFEDSTSVLGVNQL
jgi:hypothetical protein